MRGEIESWVEKSTGGRVAATRTLTGGYSNENVLVTLDDGGRFVLRRYLRRNSCAVEAALAGRLAGIVAVPEVVAADPDGAETGEPLLLSVFVPGRLLSEAPAADARALGLAAGETLARIGSVTFDAPGFFEDGALRPGPPGMEPPIGLDVFVRRCLTEGNAAGHLSDEEQEALLRYAERAAPALAGLQGARQLVHSDYNPKNILVDGRRIAAVLDW